MICAKNHWPLRHCAYTFSPASYRLGGGGGGVVVTTAGGGGGVVLTTAVVVATAGGGVGVLKGVGLPSARVFLGAMWVAEVEDRDGDGLSDDSDLF